MLIEADQAEPPATRRRSVLPMAVSLFVVSFIIGIALSTWRPATFPRLRALPELHRR
jgi:hypothetical protein